MALHPQSLLLRWVPCPHGTISCWSPGPLRPSLLHPHPRDLTQPWGTSGDVLGGQEQFPAQPCPSQPSHLVPEWFGGSAALGETPHLISSPPTFTANVAPSPASTLALMQAAPSEGEETKGSFRHAHLVTSPSEPLLLDLTPDPVCLVPLPSFLSSHSAL